MVAIIPVAGIGSRLRPHTFSIHKVLITVAGKPVIDYIIDELLSVGIKKIVFITGHLGEQIQNHVTEKYGNIKGRRFSFVEQKEQKGLAHAIYMAKELVPDKEDVLIVLGDTVFKMNLQEIVSNPASVLCVKKVKDPRRFGVVVKRGKFAKQLIEKPDNPISNLALVGLYKITNSTLLWEATEELFDKKLKTKNEFQLTDALQIMLDKNEKMEIMEIENWFDCGKPETLLSTNRELLSLYAKKKKIEGNLIIPPVYIDKTAKVKQSIIGPFVTIGKNVEIDNSIIADAIVENNASVKNINLKTSLIGARALVVGKPNRLNISDSTEVEF